MANRRYRHPGRADMAAVRELDLYSQNDYETYSRCYRPLVVAATKHAKKGNMNPEKLCRAMRKRCVPLAIKRYTKEFGTFPVTTADRNVLSAYMCANALSDVKDELRNSSKKNGKKTRRRR